MATNEQRFLISLKETQDLFNKLGLLSSTDDQLRARVKLNALIQDAAAYLGGRKRDAILSQTNNARELWDYLTNTRKESVATKKRRILRYLTNVQQILGLPEAQVPIPTGEDKAKIDKVTEKIDEAKRKHVEKGGRLPGQEGGVDKKWIKLGGGAVALGVGLWALSKVLKKKKRR